MTAVPASTSICMRPVWRRRQRRHYGLATLPPPDSAEIHDAIQVLALPEAMLAEMPAVWIEAQTIMCEASE